MIFPRALPDVLCVLLVAALEAFTAFWIRDNLILNIVMLLYPLDAIREWRPRYRRDEAKDDWRHCRLVTQTRSALSPVGPGALSVAAPVAERTAHPEWWGDPDEELGFIRDMVERTAIRHARF